MASRSPQSPQKDVVLLSVGPFQGLDATTSPYYVAQNNATATQNVAVNRVYASYCTAQGRTANYLQTTFSPLGGFPNFIQAIGTTDVGLAGVPTVFVVYGDGGAINNGLYAGGYTGVGVASVTRVGAITFGPGPSGRYSSPATTESRFVFAQNQVYYDGLAVAGGKFICLGQFSVSSSPYGVFNWGITAPGSSPTAAAGGAGNLTGTYYYAVTFTSSFTPNGESSPCAFTTGLALSAQQASLTAIPTSGDAQVNGRNIYRFGGTIGGTPLLVGSIADNSTTTFTDNLADSAVTGQQLILRQDPAPSFNTIEYHKGRMWGCTATDISLVRIRICILAITRT